MKETNNESALSVTLFGIVSSEKWDAYASVTPDGKYLLFNRGVDLEGDNRNVDIYWVDAQVIEGLRPVDQ